MKVLGEFVLIRQTTTKKKGVIHLDTAKSDTDKFDFEHKIEQVGEDCKKKIKVGDTPVFSAYVQFSAVKVIEKNNNGMVTLMIVHEGDIIATDNPEEEATETSKLPNIAKL